MNVTVIHKLPGEEPKVIQLDRDDYKALQELVGGYFETMWVRSDIVLWFDEEGQRKGLQPNLDFPNGGVILGPVLLTGRKGDLIADVPDISFALGVLHGAAV